MCTLLCTLISSLSFLRKRRYEFNACLLEKYKNIAEREEWEWKLMDQQRDRHLRMLIFTTEQARCIRKERFQVKGVRDCFK